MATVSGEARQSQSLKEMWVISSGHGFTHWYQATFFILLPLIGKELGLSYSQIGFIMSVQYGVSAFSNLWGGVLVDFVKKKKLVLAASLFWVGFPYFLMSFTNSYLMLLTCVALVGMGNSLWHPTAIPALSQRYPQRKSFVLSIHSMGANIGDALAPLTIGFLLGFLGWKQVVVWNVIPGVLIAIVLLLILQNLQSDAKGSPTDTDTNGISIKEYGSGLVELVRNKSLILITAGSGLRSMTQNALLTFLPLYMVQVIELPTFWVGFSMFTLQACGFIAAPVAGYMSDQMGRKKIIMASMSMIAVVVVMMAVANNSKFFIVFVALLGFFLYAIRPVMQAWLLESTPPKMAGTSVGLLFGIQSFSSAISPLIGGSIADLYGLYAAFYFVAFTIIMANLLIFFVPGEVGHNTQENFRG